MASDTEYFELLDPSERHPRIRSRRRGSSRFLTRKFIAPLILCFSFIIIVITVVASSSKSPQRSQSSSGNLTIPQSTTKGATSSSMSMAAASVAPTGTITISPTVNKAGNGGEVKGHTVKPSSVFVETIPSTSKPNVTMANSSITVATNTFGVDGAGHADNNNTLNATHSNISQPILSQAKSNASIISTTGTHVTAVKAEVQVNGRTEEQRNASSASTHLPTLHSEPTASNATSSAAKISPKEPAAVAGGEGTGHSDKPASLSNH